MMWFTFRYKAFTMATIPPPLHSGKHRARNPFYKGADHQQRMAQHPNLCRDYFGNRRSVPAVCDLGRMVFLLKAWGERIG